MKDFDEDAFVMLEQKRATKLLREKDDA